MRRVPVPFIILAAATAPVLADPPARDLRIEKLGEYRTGAFDASAAEIAAYDAATTRLFVTNSDRRSVDVLDLSDPAHPVLLMTLDVAGYGAGATSVATHDGRIAVAVPANTRTDPGQVVFFDAQGAVQAHVPVGALPDMLAFTPNGRYLVVANEGEPADDYLTDPPGTVSVIDMPEDLATLGAAHVRSADFARFDTQGVPPGVRVFGPGATPSQDLEPEYVALSDDSRTAWVTLQENNAIAQVDLKRGEVVALHALGFKDHAVAGAGLDPSDRDDAIAIAPWPVRGLYLPDAIAAFRHQGRTLLVTANEGDARDYGGFGEEVRVGDLALDPEAFPNAAALQTNAALRRLRVTNTLGDADGDGDFDALYSFGARSLSVWDAASGERIADTGDALERLTAAAVPEFFNSNNDENNFDARSDDKGPEPEGVTTARLFGRQYAFLTLERVGGVVAFELTDPAAPRVAGHFNDRDFAGDPEADSAGNLGPEGVLVIPAEHSPNGEPLLVVTYEVSGSTGIYRLHQAD